MRNLPVCWTPFRINDSPFSTNLCQGSYALYYPAKFSQYTYNYIPRIPRLALAPMISSNLLSRSSFLRFNISFSFKSSKRWTGTDLSKTSWRYSWRSFATRCVRWISFPLKYHLNLFHERFAHSKIFALPVEYYVISTFFGKTRDFYRFKISENKKRRERERERGRSSINIKYKII